MKKRLIILISFVLILAACNNTEPDNINSDTVTDSPTAVVAEPTKEVTQPEPTLEPTEPTISAYAAEIIERGTVRVGINNDPLYPFIDPASEPASGFEVDLADVLVDLLFEGQVTVEWVPITAAERLEYLENGQIDLLVRATTHTLSREANGLWSQPYFLDGQRVLVTAGSEISELSQLDGQTICVPLGTAWEANLESHLTELGITFELIELGQGEAFMEGACTAVSTDWSLLMHQGLSFNMMGGDSPAWTTIGPILSGQVDNEQWGHEPLAVGIPLEQELFLAEVNEALQQIIDDGTWQMIYDEWFPEPAPWTTAEMLAAPPADR